MRAGSALEALDLERQELPLTLTLFLTLTLNLTVTLNLTLTLAVFYYRADCFVGKQSI